MKRNSQAVGAGVRRDSTSARERRRTRNNAKAFLIEGTLAALHTRQLRRLCFRLNADETALLVAIAERLTAGRKTYGELQLARDPRNFAGEALEEALDMAIYSAAALTRAEKLAAEERASIAIAEERLGALSENQRQKLTELLSGAFSEEVTPTVVSQRDRSIRPKRARAARQSGSVRNVSRGKHRRSRAAINRRRSKRLSIEEKNNG